MIGLFVKFKKEVSLITNISKDHQQWLGNDIPTIAKEKAGIIKSSIPVVISERQSEIENTFIQIAKEFSFLLIYFLNLFLHIHTSFKVITLPQK